MRAGQPVTEEKQVATVKIPKAFFEFISSTN
jgi:hypothetical protein